MKKMIVGLCMVLLLFAGSAFGAAWDWNGDLTGRVQDVDDLDGVVANGAWSSATLDWTVFLTPSNGLWTYTYTFNSMSSKAISHFNLELTPSIPDGDELMDPPRHFEIYAPYTNVVYETFYQGGDNPGLLDSFYGLKYGFPDSITAYEATFTIITSRAPMAGDFYAKDGTTKIEGEQVWNYFWVDNAIPVPDSADTAVPIPGAVVILGFGLLGLVGARKKFVK